MHKTQQTLLDYFRTPLKMTQEFDASFSSVEGETLPTLRKNSMEFYVMNILRKQEQQTRQIQDLYRELQLVKDQYKRHCTKNVSKKITQYLEIRTATCPFQPFIINTLFQNISHASLERVWSNRTIFDSFKEELAIQIQHLDSDNFAKAPILCFQERKHRVWVYEHISTETPTLFEWRPITFQDIHLILSVYRKAILNVWIAWGDKQVEENNTDSDYYEKRFQNFISKDWRWMDDENKKMRIINLLYDHWAIPLP